MMESFRYRTAIFLLLAAFPLLGAYNVIEFSISCRSDETRIKIFTDHKPQVADNVLKNPDRLELSFTGGINQFKTNEFNNLPAGLVMSIRINHKSEMPNPVTTVTMDIADTPGKYSTETVADGFSIVIPTPGYPEIDNFRSGRKAEIPKAPSEPVTIKQPETKKPQETKPEEKKPTEQVKEPEKPVEQPPAEKTEPESHPDPETGRDLPEDFIPPTDADGELVSDTTDNAYYIRDRIVYEQMIDRDPFVRVNNAEEVTIGKYSSPGIEGIVLVGIVGSAGDFTALLQDGKGFGYMLGKGDSVLNGIVVEVNDSSVVFRIDEYGYIRDVKMPLKRTLK